MKMEITKTIRANLRGWKKEHEGQLRELHFTAYLIRRNPLSMLGMVFIGALLLTAIFAPYLPLHDPFKMDLPAQYQPPSWDHPFGTDEMGMDIFSKVIWGTRIDLLVAFITLGTATAVGSCLGAISGYLGGKIDEVIMRVADIFLSIPGLIFALLISAAIGTRSIETVMISLSIVWWPSYARLVRGQTLSLRETLFIEAERAVGANRRRILFSHVLPNCLTPIIVSVTMDVGRAILATASLSFLGVGAGPGAAEWGRMIADGRNWIQYYPWMVIFPGLAIFISVLGFSLLGDALRDIFDPRLRR